MTASVTTPPVPPAVAPDRLQLLDCARFVAAIGVIAAHVIHEFFPDDPHWVLGTFAVPFYLFVALYFSARALTRLEGDASPGRSRSWYLLGRARKLYLPFIAWNLIYDALHVLRHPQDGFTSFSSLVWAATYTHLYFPPFLLAATAALAIVIAVAPKGRGARWICSAGLVVAGLILAMGPQPTWLNDPMQVERETVWNFYRALTTACFAGAFALVLGTRIRRFSTTPIVALLGILVLLTSLGIELVIGQHPLLRTASGFGLMLVAFLPFYSPLLRPIAWAGRLSFGVYLSHVAFTRGAIILADHADLPHSPAVAIAVGAVGLAGGLVITAILSRSEWTSWIVGCERSEGSPSAVTCQASPAAGRIAQPQTAGPLPNVPR